MEKSPVPNLLCVRISGPDESVREFLKHHPMQVESTSWAGELVILETFITKAVLDQIKDQSLKVETLFDATARGRERQKEVGKGNRFEGDQKIPPGLGVKTGEPPR